MFLSYLKDMKSWILFFSCSLLFIDILIWIDKGLDLKRGSLAYLNLLLIIAFFIFFIWRYKREMFFTNELQRISKENLSLDWQEDLPDPVFIREEILRDLLQEVARDYSKIFSKIKEANLIENDYTTAWVHEIKGPLTAMKMNIDANREIPAIRKIEAEWLRLHLLIDRQLYISRLPSLESDYILEQTALTPLINAEIRELFSWCMEKNIAVEVEETDLEVITDIKWCRFIIRQLLTNAVKYSPAGGIILITVGQSQNGHPLLIIKDEGPGISAHDLPRLFDKGFTGDTGRLQNAATGLGLYLAQQVATKIGISLSAQSTRDGATLSIAFPTENEYDSIRM